MNKEEYIEKRQALQEELKKLNRKLLGLDYLFAHSGEFKPGMRVRVTYIPPGGRLEQTIECFIHQALINPVTSEIEYRFVGENSDGTMTRSAVGLGKKGVKIIKIENLMDLSF